MTAIEVQDLHKSYGSHVALRGISFSIDEGEVVGFLGPNGAGKSTAMKIITGFLAPSSGAARIQGHNVLEEPIIAQKKIGYLPENAPIYPDMRIRDYLDYIGRIRRLGRAERARAIERVAHECGITQRLGQPCGHLSKGYRQRVGLAQALLHEPPILILDEPTTGLDPNQKGEILDRIRRMGQRRTVILSTHILEDVERTCDRVIIIKQGQLVATGSTEEVTTRSRGGQLLEVVLAPGTVVPSHDTVAEALAGIEGVTQVFRREALDPKHYSFKLLTTADVRAAIFHEVVRRGLVLLELSRPTVNLQEVFRQVTTD